MRLSIPKHLLSGELLKAYKAKRDKRKAEKALAALARIKAHVAKLGLTPA